MNLQNIKYGRKNINVKFKILKNLYGYFETEKELLVIDSRIKGLKLFDTIIHELFHIVIHFEKVNVKIKSEEKIAMAVGNGFTKIFKQNSSLLKKLYNLI